MVVYKRRRPSGRRMRRMTKKRRIVRRRRVRGARLNVKRTFWVENWTPNTTTTNGFWRYYQTSIGVMPSIAEFTAMFDQYRINAVKITFRPRFDNFGGNDTTDTTLPGVTNQAGCMMHVCKDPYSVVGPTGTYTSANLNAFFEQGNVRTYTGNRAFSVYYKPTINKTVDGAGGSNNVERARAPYINSNNIQVVHNGFHVFAQDVNLTGTFGQSFDVYITYYMTWKNLR